MACLRIKWVKFYVGISDDALMGHLIKRLTARVWMIGRSKTFVYRLSLMSITGVNGGIIMGGSICNEFA